jgi:hypothetical protein
MRAMRAASAGAAALGIGVGMLGLAGCQSTPDGAPKQAIADNPACHGVMHAVGFLRPGAIIPVSLHVQNNGKRCWWAAGFSGLSLDGLSLQSRPSHGDAIARGGQGTALIGYRPQPGYAGSDNFVVEFPTDYAGASISLSMDVTVVP